MCDDELPSRILNIWAINTHTYTRKYNRVVCICKLSARLHRQLCGQTPEWLTAAGFLAIACYLCACVCAGRQSDKPGWGNNNTMHVVYFFLVVCWWRLHTLVELQLFRYFYTFSVYSAFALRVDSNHSSCFLAYVLFLLLFTGICTRIEVAHTVQLSALDLRLLLFYTIMCCLCSRLVVSRCWCWRCRCLY